MLLALPTTQSLLVPQTKSMDFVLSDNKHHVAVSRFHFCFQESQCELRDSFFGP